MNNVAYKEMIYNPEISPLDIMNEIEIPKSVFKYRKFVDFENPSIETFWEESLNGTMYFSLPTMFNSNDSEDCVFLYDKDKCKEKILKKNNLPSENKEIFTIPLINDIWTELDRIITQVRENIKIGCFTSLKPENEFMWECKEFGAEHMGYCIEYEVDALNFYPQKNVFLPVLYEENHIDMTDVVLDLINLSHNNDNLETHTTLMSNGYNFCLCKTNTYKNEYEWRIIVTENKWKEYFDIDHSNKKDFSNKMKAVYLGADCDKLDCFEKYIEYAKKICNDKSIPLYQMKKESKGLSKVQIY